MLRRLSIFLGLILSCIAFQQKALATEINSTNYDIYIGDVNGDSYKDFYFRGKPLWIILFGDISIPIPLNLNFDFVVYGANDTYSVPVVSPLTATSFFTQVANGSLVLAQNNLDYFIVAGVSTGQTNILLRGTDVSKPAIMLASFNSTLLPLISQIYSTAAFPGISDRNFTITMRDVNNDGIVDLVIEDTTSGATYGGTKTAYISDGSGTPSIFRELRPSSAAPSIPSGASYVGTTSGQFRVDESGAATYSIPIAIADGIAGVKPQVELNYSSGAGVGIAGRGWSLSGLSSISRCRQTLAQDNNPQPITWSATDRFCLDGQRLILVSGTYGSVGSTYKTEIDSVIEAKAVGGSAGHPAYFEVKAKDGSITTYGGTTDSKLSGSSTNANTTVLNWARSRFEDNMHNAIEYMYEGDAATGQRIKTIFYAYKTILQTTRGATDAQAKVEFAYDNKTDPSTAYVYGYLFGQTKRLISIKVFNSVANSAPTELRTYNLNYLNVAANASDNRGIKDISRLAWIQECRGSACLAPTQFDWGGGKQITYSTGINKFITSESPDVLSIPRKTFADVTGDGKQDLVYITALSATWVQLRVRDDDSANSNSNNLVKSFSITDVNRLDLRSLDYNADGRQDIALFDGLKWILLLSTPSPEGLWSLQQSDFNIVLNERGINFVDVNSDGLVDVVSSTGYRLLEIDSTKPISSNKYYKFGALTTLTLNSSNIYSEFTANYQSTSPTIASSSCILQPGFPVTLDTDSLVDFNGDGVTDFAATVTQTFKCQDSSITQYDPTVTVHRSAKYAFVVRGTELIKFNGNAIFSFVNGTSTGKHQFMDVNGDGLSDHVTTYGNLYGYRLNNGIGFNTAQTWYSLPVYPAEPKQTVPQFTDFNGDGFMDLLWVDRNLGKLRVLFWGSQTPIDVDTVSNDPTNEFIITDVSGDGIGDLIKFGPKSVYAKYGRYVEEPTGACVNYSSAYGNYCAPAPVGYDATKQNLNITAIINGTGAATQIHYGTLSNSGRYTTQDVDGTVVSGGSAGQCTKNSEGFIIYCTAGSLYSYLDTTSFYTRLNGGWLLPVGSVTLNATNTHKGKPVLEMNGPMAIVTSVEASAPTAGASAYAVNQSAMSKINYYYGDAKMQASGRGFLGFGRLQTVDAQTGVTTVTQYRQDFPFIGSPLSTTVYSGDATSSKILSYAINKWNFKEKSGADGTKYYLPYLEQSVEKTHDADSLTNPVLQTVATNNTYDSFGNLTNIVATTSGKKADGVTTTSLTQTVINEFGTPTVADFNNLYGRLKKTTVTTQRDTETPKTKISDFLYETSGAKQGLLKTQSIQGGASTTYTYDNFGNKTAVSVTALNAQGVSETRNSFNDYSTDGRYLTATRNDLSQAAQILARNEYGQATSGLDINNVASATTYYDAMGQAYMVKDPSGAWSRTENRWCSGISCPAGAAYRKSSRVSGGGEAMEYFDKLGRTTRTSKRSFDGRWSNIDTEYDNLGRIKRQSTPFFSSDSAGSVQATAWTTTAYDYLGRPVSITLPDSSVSSMSYNGNTTASTNSASQTKTETRNGLGQLVKVTDHLGGVIEYEYNLYGSLLTATTRSGGQSIAVRMCYDDLGRKTAMLDPDKGGAKAAAGDATLDCASIGLQRVGWWTYKYNGFSELVKQIDAKGQSTEFTYDVTGRMATRTDKYANGNLDLFTRWYYDTNINGTPATGAKGKVTAIIANNDASQTCTSTSHCTYFGYDNLTRSLKNTVVYSGNPTSFSSETKYDEFGRVYEQTDPLNGTVLGTSGTQTRYNQYGYAYESIDLNDGSLIQRTLSTNARGQVLSELRGNGANSSYNYYDTTGLLKTQQASLNGGMSYIQNNTYVWDSIGNLKSRLNLSALIGSTVASTNSKNLSETFCYDGLNRLIKTNNTSGSNPVPTPACTNIAQDVTYDGFGNIKTKSGVGTYTYGTNAGPHAVTNTTSDGAYTYDNNGNQLSGAGRTLDYTSYDMVKLISKAANKVEFSYGPDRARWQRKDTRTTGTTVTTYLGNIERIEVLGSGVVEWKRYVGGAVFTYKTNTSNLLQTGSEKRFIYNDHLGSLDVITDAAGKVTHSESFDVWGARRNGETWNPNTYSSTSLTLVGYTQPITNRGFTGHEMVDDMGIIHMNGRIYDPRLARFLQADPFVDGARDTQGYNRYAYVRNNPLNATDPSGYFAWGAAVAWAIGSYAAGRFAKKSGYTWVGQAAAIIGCIYGACGSAAFGSTYGSTGNFGMAMIAGVSAGALGGLSGPAKFFASGALGGISSVMQGGNFANGFIVAGFSSVAGGGGNEYTWQGMLGSAVAGATISAATGGKFKSGAISSAFSYAMSWGAQKLEVGRVEEWGYEYTDSDEVDVVVNQLKGTFKKTADGNLEINATVSSSGSEDGNESRARLFKLLNGKTFKTDGQSLIVNLTEHNGEGVGDMHAVSQDEMRNRTVLSSKFNKKMARNGQTGKMDCQSGCAVKMNGQSWVYVGSLLSSEGALHEVFHTYGVRHRTEGLMRTNGRTLTGTDLNILYTLYFGGR